VVLAEFNKKNVKPYDKVFSLKNNREYFVSTVEEDCIYTHTKDGYSHPFTPRLGFDDFKIMS
jgi:hypothetical protein